MELGGAPGGGARQNLDADADSDEETEDFSFNEELFMTELQSALGLRGTNPKP